jgi:hypothetical protein
MEIVFGSQHNCPAEAARHCRPAADSMQCLGSPNCAYAVRACWLHEGHVQQLLLLQQQQQIHDVILAAKQKH